MFVAHVRPGGPGGAGGPVGPVGPGRWGLPRDAPVWVNALNCWILNVVEGEALPDLSTVHAHADLHGSHARQRGGGVAHDLRHGASKGERESYSLSTVDILRSTIYMSVRVVCPL